MFEANGHAVWVTADAWRVGDALGGAATDLHDPAHAHAIHRLIDTDGLAELRAAVALAAAGAGPGPAAPVGRPSIRYVGGFGRANARGYWLMARTLRLSGPHTLLEVSVDQVAAQGLPSGHPLPAAIAEQALRAATQRAQLPCACGTGAPSPDAHGQVRTLGSAQHPGATIEVTVRIGECAVCGCRWRFYREGDSHYSFREAASPSRL